MPHVIVKLYPGRTAEQKQRLTQEIVKNVTSITECDESVVSVSFEEVAPDNWKEQVYEPDIIGKKATLTKAPGYTL